MCGIFFSLPSSTRSSAACGVVAIILIQLCVLWLWCIYIYIQDEASQNIQTHRATICAPHLAPHARVGVCASCPFVGILCANVCGLVCGVRNTLAQTTSNPSTQARTSLYFILYTIYTCRYLYTDAARGAIPPLARGGPPDEPTECNFVTVPWRAVQFNRPSLQNLHRARAT